MAYSKTFFIALIAVLINVNMDTAVTGSTPVLGTLSCQYLGFPQDMCSYAPFVAVSDLPQECSSLVYHNVKADDLVELNKPETKDEKTNHIQSLVDSGKPTFLFYSHSNIENWINNLSDHHQDTGSGIKDEISNLKTYLGKYPKLSGLIIDSLQYVPTSESFSDLTEHFNSYLKEMRSNLPNLGIGISFLGSTFMTNSEDEDFEWFNFKELDANIDFYVIKVYNLNACTSELMNGGSTPVKDDKHKSLTKLAELLEKAGIPKTKIHYQIDLGVKSSSIGITFCELTNTKRCDRKDFDGLCADSSKTFYDKGNFIQENSAGFMTVELDLVDDPTDTCGCGKYPALHYILDGFNKAAVPTPCDKFDKISK